MILVDRQTASAAEIFAAALQDNGRAVIAGEPTYGKGWAGVFDRDGEYRKACRVKRPSGGEIDGVGVTPDLAV
jgi:carboxyl-terminal processing protease